jgi:hypothetical protein
MTKLASDFPILSDVVKYECERQWGRDRSDVTYNGAAATLEIGTVLAKVTATGKYVIHAPAASDGSQNAIAVVVEKKVVPATTDTKVMVVGGDVPYLVETGLNSTGLIFPTITGPQLTAAYASLGAKGFQIITGVAEVL